VLKSQSAVIALRRLMLTPDISRDLIAMEIAQREFREQRFRISPLPLVMSFFIGPNRGDHVKV
jgi:hypothetical protein